MTMPRHLDIQQTEPFGTKPEPEHTLHSSKPVDDNDRHLITIHNTDNVTRILLTRNQAINLARHLLEGHDYPR